MENIESTEQVQPTWWDAKHTSAWDRVKEAMRRDWEQTKADFSSKHGEELDQDVPDTLKQAAGTEEIPPPGVPNAKDWAKTEPAVRYGFGARDKYGSDFKTWEPGLETKLRSDWDTMKSDVDFDSARDDIRYGWDWHDEKGATRH